MSEEAAGIVLAAGEGRRFGGPKALARVANVRLVEHAVSVLDDGGCRPVFVVLGAGADEVESECDLSRAEVARNEAWSTGIAGSLLLGLDEAGRTGAGSAIVLHVDQPLVSPALIARLIAVWREEGKSVVACFAGEPVSPTLIDGGRWAEVRAAVAGDRGAKEILLSKPDLVSLIDCDDVGDPLDVDSPEELEAAGKSRVWRSLFGDVQN